MRGNFHVRFCSRAAGVTPSLRLAKADPHYAAIVRAVNEILATTTVVAPVEVFVRMNLLSTDDLESWRQGRVPYLEKVIHCNLSKASRVLRILRFHAHDLNLEPSLTVYLRRVRGKKLPLRFSKTGEPSVEEAYARHFVVLGGKKARRSEEA
jgi:hypothetical protein